MRPRKDAPFLNLYCRTELFSNNAISNNAVSSESVYSNYFYNFLFNYDEAAVDRILMRHFLLATTAREHCGAECNSE